MRVLFVLSGVEAEFGIDLYLKLLYAGKGKADVVRFLFYCAADAYGAALLHAL
jgi:hypothetical protein